MNTIKKNEKLWQAGLLLCVFIFLTALNAECKDSQTIRDEIKGVSYYEDISLIESIDIKTGCYTVPEGVVICLMDVEKDPDGSRIKTDIQDENKSPIPFSSLEEGQRIYTYGMKLKDGRIFALTIKRLKK